MRNFILIAFFLVANLKNARAQFIYPNDVCSGARPLQVSITGELTDSVYQRNVYADTALSPVPNCGGTINARYDLWYSFIAPAATVALVPENYTGFYQLFSGSCGNLVSIACNSAETTFEPFTGLIPGQQYYLRTYSIVKAPTASNFKLSLVSAPVNDFCTNAPLLPVNPLHSEGLPLKTFTNELATATTDNSCGNLSATWPGYEDVWFKFVATNAAHSVYIQAPATGTRVAVYTGALGSLTQTGSTFNSSASVTTGAISLTNLTVGQTYYVRAGGTAVVKFSFSIVTGAPANDECPNADTVLMSSSFGCENTFTFKRIGATTSATPCAASSPNDVWFVFQATVPDITVKGLGNYASGIKLGLLNGNCGALTCLANSSTETLNYSGLVVGNYYYLKVGGVSFVDKDFYICIAPRITNDECSGAITIPVKPYNKLKTTVGNVDGATSSMLTCSGQVDEDVWFKFIATDTACVITADGETAFPNFQVLGGTCGALTSVHCSAENALPSGVYVRTEKVNGLVPGNEYYVRYMPSNGSGFFTLDINSLPPNDDCAGATTLVPKPTLDFEFMNNNGILHASPSMAPCVAATFTNDIWYKFTATGTSAAVVSDRGIGNSPTTVLGFQVFEGSCAALNPIVCFEQGLLLHKAQTLTGLTPGQTYYVRQYGNFSANRVGIVDAPANDEISGAVKLVAAPASVQAMPSYSLHGASKQFGKICTASPSTIHHDVWFYFIAEAASHIVSVNTFNSFWDEQMTGYSYRLEAFRGYATDSATLAAKLIGCAATSLTVGGLTAGDTVFVRVSNTAAANNTSIFSMKVTSTKSIDEPAGALTLTKTDGYQYSLSTAGATQSLPAMGCSIADFPDDDIWLTFTAATDIKRVVAGFENRDITIQLFSGTPGNLTSIKCSNNIMVLPGNLANGTVYYLRTYSKVPALPAQFQIGLFGEEAVDVTDCIGNSCIGTNLVVNPHIETDDQYLLPQTNAGTSIVGRKLTEGWYNASSATPDVWDADYPSGDWSNIPGNTGGARTRIPRSGKGMLGILNGLAIDWHEYVSGKLTQPLVPGKTYVVSFYVNVASVSLEESIPLFGAYFSNDSIIGVGRAPVETMPHISNTPGEPVNEVNGWRKICGIFYADKPYTFITLGSFGPPTIFNSTNQNYIYIDDVMVAETSVCGALPLKLLNFRGRSNEQKQSELKWETSGEMNVSRFEIEWRADGTTFSKIGTVRATGTGSAMNRYEFLHTTPSNGYNYYRLKMIDNDGKFSYSSIVRTGNQSGGSGLTVYPNPVASTLHLNAQSERDEMVLFSLVQTDGRVVATKQVMLRKGSNTFSWNVGNFAAGIYLITSSNRSFGTIKISRQ